MSNSYQNLEETFRKLNNIRSAAGVLHWDSSVMMPKGGADIRSEQLATLSAFCHEILTDKKVPDLIAKAKTETKKLNDWQKSNLRLMEKQYIHASAVDKKLVFEFSKAGSESEMIWREARGENNFKKFRPYLEKIISFVREIADAKAKKLKCSPYDALLDQYDPGRKSAEIDLVFDDLRKFIPDFLNKALKHQKSKKLLPLKGPFPVEKQKELGLKVMRAIGFDFNHGRLDVSHHPFCGGTPGDVRLTTRYNESDFTSSFMGVVHETGHAMYENGLPVKWRNQPAGEALGMSIHESMSLLMEMQVARSEKFLEFAAPLIREVFHKTGKEWEPENIYNHYTALRGG